MDRSTLLDRSDGRSIFGTDAAGYHQSRPGYPPALFEHLQSRVPRSPAILEIGAGTGLASSELLKFEPCHLTIVEPDAELCRFLDDRFRDAAVTVLQGTFPDVAIDGQFDLAACAAAFHWMDPEAALAKVRSLLAPGGTWAMWWNCYFGHGESDPLAEHAHRLLREEKVALPPSYVGGNHYALDRDWHVGQLERAGFSDIEHAVFRTARTLSPEQAADLYRTFSFIRLLSAEAQERILNRIAEIVATKLGGQAEATVVSSLYMATG
jgi:SAM-dependent methyltransferase